MALADDVTGAADTAARVFTAGLAASIVIGGAAPRTAAVALTSDSRHLDAIGAAERVRVTVSGVETPPGTIWYKKIDSTLRGQIAAELDALLDALGCPYAAICPAFPAQGRGLLGGRLVAPDACGEAPSLMALLAASARPVALVELETLRAGQPALETQLKALVAAGARLLAIDALSDDDLELIERALAAALPDALRCGSAGLAGALARRLATESLVRHPHAARATGPALLVIGSASPASRRQLDTLRASGGAQLIAFEPQRSDPLATGKTGDIALHLPPPDDTVRLDGPAARQMAERLAEAACALVEQLEPGLIVLAGGDTAAATLGSLGVRRLDVQAELLPGMPLAYGVDGAGRKRLFVLKAGAHGDESALLELLRRARHDD